jgi:putative ABC transport system permease protein
MNDSMINVGWINVVVGLGLVVIAIGLTYFNGFGFEKEIAYGIFRTILQLGILGYVLVYVLLIKQVWITVLILLAMSLIAAYTARGRIRRPYPGAIPVLWISISLGSFFALLYITMLTLSDPKALSPRYLIPLGGMVIGNVLNGITLAMERFRSELDGNKDRVEVLLAMGADSYEASRECAKASFVAAMIPMVNSLIIMGLIQIPGIMSGQILTGADPLIAAKYQILVMFMLLGGEVTSLALFLKLVVGKYFTPDHQLRRELL